MHNMLKKVYLWLRGCAMIGPSIIFAMTVYLVQGQKCRVNNRWQNADYSFFGRICKYAMWSIQDKRWKKTTQQCFERWAIYNGPIGPLRKKGQYRPIAVLRKFKKPYTLLFEPCNTSKRPVRVYHSGDVRVYWLIHITKTLIFIILFSEINYAYKAKRQWSVYIYS